MNLFGSLRTDYGQDIVKKVGSFEKLHQKISRHRNHLIFSLRCKDENIIPASLKLKCPINSQAVHTIVKKAQKELLRERIRLTHNNLKKFEDQRDISKQDLSIVLNEETTECVMSLAVKSGEKVFARQRSDTNRNCQNC